MWHSFDQGQKQEEVNDTKDNRTLGPDQLHPIVLKEVSHSIAKPIIYENERIVSHLE